MNFSAAMALIQRFDDAGDVARYIVGQMLADPDAEDYWRALAGACHELFTAERH